MPSVSTADIIIAGGGLAGALAAVAIRRCRPDLDLLLLERGPALGGNHTWSFFASDLDAQGHALVTPFLAASWPAYQVRFPGHARRLATGYHSIASVPMGRAVAAELAGAVRLGAEVTAIGPDEVRLASGETLSARCVIDARGARASPHLALGFQKFLGLEVRTAVPHGETVPTIMDATVPQRDGYRFVYTLPLAPDRLLIEDTYYSDGDDLAQAALRQRIADYAAARGWAVAETVREEAGVLPIILAGDIERHLAAITAHDAAPPIGLAAGLFHPTTGYSLPDAVRVALALGTHCEGVATPDAASVRALIAGEVRASWQERAYFRLLNRMLFEAGRPSERYRILERFYRLDEGLVQRFYAARLTPADRLRIVWGRPPVPILSALACVSEGRMMRRRGGAA